MLDILVTYELNVIYDEKASVKHLKEYLVWIWLFFWQSSQNDKSLYHFGLLVFFNRRRWNQITQYIEIVRCISFTSKMRLIGNVIFITKEGFIIYNSIYIANTKIENEIKEKAYRIRVIWKNSWRK